MSHLSRTTSERKALNNVIHVADGMTTSSKSRSVSVAAGWAIASHPPASSRRSPSSTSGVVAPRRDDALVVWDQSEAVDDSLDPTIKPSAKFTGFTQCMLAVPWVDHGTPIEEVWMGDGDGRIVIRSLASVGNEPVALSSELASSPTSKNAMSGVIKKYFGVFVTALERGSSNVWAGYSDGAVRAFSIKSHKEVFEAPRRHGGSINRLLFVEAPADYGNHNPLMLSASEDFRIHAHHVGTFSFLFQLIAPGACIRCMASDGDYLFTGGDDGVIRCWSLEQKCETQVPGVYPLHAYQEGGVRSLDLHQNALFACGGSCGSMWDVVDGSLLAVFNVPENVKAVRSTIVPSGFTLWISASDGFAYVFDISDLSLIQVADSHASSLIKCVEVVHRAPVLQTVATFQDGFMYAYSEAGRLGASYTSFPPELQAKLEHLERAQEEIVRQRVQIRRQAATMRKYKALFAQFRDASAKAMEASRASANSTTVSSANAAQKQLQWNQFVFDAASAHLSKACVGDVLHRVFRKWAHTAHHTAYERSQHVLGTALLRNAQEAFQGSCVRGAVSSQRRRERQQSLQRVALDLLHRIHRAQSIRFLDTWKFFVNRNKLITKQQDVATMLEKRVQASHCAARLKVWSTYRSQCKRQRLEKAAEDAATAATLRIEFGRKRFLAREEAMRDEFLERRSSLAKLLQANTLTRRLRECFANWLTRTVAGAQAKREKVVYDMERKVETLTRELEEIEANADITEQEIDEQIATREGEVEKLEAAVRARELVILQLRDVEQDIQRRMHATGVPIPPNLPHFPRPIDSIVCEAPIAQHGDVAICDNIMRTMMQRGMNCRSHWDTVVDAGRHASTKPGATFVKNIEQAKRDAAEAFGPRPRQPSPAVQAKGRPMAGASTPRGVTATRPMARLVSSSRSTSAAVRPGTTRTPSSARAPSARSPVNKPAKAEAALPQPSAGSVSDDKWIVDMVLLEKTNRVVLKRVVGGLRQAIVAWYYLRSKLNPDSDKIKNLAEIKANASLWIQLLEKERLMEDAALEKDAKLPWGGSAAGGSRTHLLPTPSSHNLDRRGSSASVTAPRLVSSSSQSARAPSSPRAGGTTASTVAKRQPLGATRASSPVLLTPRRSAEPGAAESSQRSTRYPMAHRIATPGSTAASRARASGPKSDQGRSTTPSRQLTTARAQQPTPSARARTPVPSRASVSSLGSPPSGAATQPRVSSIRRASSTAGRREISPVQTEQVFM